MKLAKATFRHAVFGYGSLMSSESAALTAPTLTQCRPFPCVIQGIERAWNKRSRQGMTAMGVQWSETGSCTGVLYPVCEEEIARFDEREIGYVRHAIDLRHVELLDYLEEEHYKDHAEFLRALQQSNRGKTELNIWVYVPETPLPPDENHPIAQSYVDVILQGCLDIHEEFARDFLQDTKGWDPRELSFSESESEDDETLSQVSSDSAIDSNDVIAWVNDRDRPIYSRADTVYSKKNGRDIDKLLHEHRPEVRCRKPILLTNDEDDSIKRQ